MPEIQRGTHCEGSFCRSLGLRSYNLRVFSSTHLYRGFSTRHFSQSLCGTFGRAHERCVLAGMGIYGTVSHTSFSGTETRDAHALQPIHFAVSPSITKSRLEMFLHSRKDVLTSSGNTCSSNHVAMKTTVTQSTSKAPTCKSTSYQEAQTESAVAHSRQARLT